MKGRKNLSQPQTHEKTTEKIEFDRNLKIMILKNICFHVK